MKYPPSIACVLAADIAIHRIASILCTAWARWMLRFQGCRAGRHFVVDGRLIIRSQRLGGIEIGDQCRISSRVGVNLVGLCQPAILHCWPTGHIVIGDRVGMSSPVISSRASVRIGHRVNLGGNVRIYDHDFHSLDPRHREDPTLDKQNVRSKPVQIDDDVFIGVNAMILKGVHIGARSVVGAGAVVSMREIPPNSVVAGNPARVVRTLSVVETQSESACKAPGASGQPSPAQ